MKIRSDFVSNSSSSSFIVKVESNTPGIFVNSGERISFGVFSEKYLDRDVFECFRDIASFGSWGWYTHSGHEFSEKSLKATVKFIPDEEFVSVYATTGTREFILPECCSGYADALYRKILEIAAFNSVSTPSLYSGGEQSAEMKRRWHAYVFDLKYGKVLELDSILSEMRGRLAGILSEKMGEWEFYYAELPDCTGAEQRGQEAVSRTDWYRIFNNH